MNFLLSSTFMTYLSLLNEHCESQCLLVVNTKPMIYSLILRFKIKIFKIHIPTIHYSIMISFCGDSPGHTPNQYGSRLMLPMP